MKKGFTLIELLIVITIIGILAVAFLPQLLGAPSKARDTQRVAHLQRLAGVFTQLSVNSELPGVLTAAPEYFCIEPTGHIGGVATLDSADFGGSIPTDPDPNNSISESDGDFDDNCQVGQYGYALGPDADAADSYAFGLYARMENLENANAKCDDAFVGVITEPADADVPDNICYVILVQ